MSAMYVGCDLEHRFFHDEQGEPIPESVIRTRWEQGELDCTLMVRRLITQCDWDWDELDRQYAEFKQA